MDPLGGVQETQYDAVGRVHIERDPDGLEVTTSYDGGTGLVASRQTDGRATVTYGNYDGPLLGSVSVAGAGTTVSVYDNDGRRIETTQPDGSKQSHDINSAQRSVTTTHERMYQGGLQNAGSSEVVYDTSGRMLSSSQATVGAGTRTIAYDDHDNAGNPQSTTVTAPGIGQSAGLNLINRMVKDTVDPHQLSEYYKTIGSSEQKIRSVTYDEDTRVPKGGAQLDLTLSSGPVDPQTGQIFENKDDVTNAAVTTNEALELDRAGNVLKTKNADDLEVVYAYDLNNRVMSMTVGGRETNYTYTAGGRSRVTSVVAGGETIITSIQYDSYMRPERVTQTGAPTRSTTYDSIGRMATSTVGTLTTSYTYDALGNPDVTTYPTGAVDYDYDGQLLTQVTYPGYKTKVSDYYPSGLLKKETVAGDYEKEITYTPSGSIYQVTETSLISSAELGAAGVGFGRNLLADDFEDDSNGDIVADANGGIRNVSWNGVGSLVDIIADHGGQVVRMRQTQTFDISFSTIGSEHITWAFDRYLGADLSEGGTGVVFELSWSVDGSNWSALSSHSESQITTGNTGWASKSVPLPAGASNQATVFIRFQTTATKDADHARIDNIVVSGLSAGDSEVVTTYQYRSDNRLGSMTIAQNGQTCQIDYEYDIWGRRKATVCDGERQETTYDKRGRVTSRTTDGHIEPIAYTASGAGTRVGLRGDITFAYKTDSGFLNSATRNGGHVVNYITDDHGRVLEAKLPNGVTRRMTYANNRLDTQGDYQGTTELAFYDFDYDSDQRLSQLSERTMVLGDAVTSYQYFADGRLEQEERTGRDAMTETYTYDDSGNRSSMVRSDVTRDQQLTFVLASVADQQLRAERVAEPLLAYEPDKGARQSDWYLDTTYLRRYEVPLLGSAVTDAVLAPTYNAGNILTGLVYYGPAGDGLVGTDLGDGRWQFDSPVDGTCYLRMLSSTSTEARVLWWHVQSASEVDMDFVYPAAIPVSEQAQHIEQLGVTLSTAASSWTSPFLQKQALAGDWRGHAGYLGVDLGDRRCLAEWRVTEVLDGHSVLQVRYEARPVIRDLADDAVLAEGNWVLIHEQPQVDPAPAWVTASLELDASVAGFVSLGLAGEVIQQAITIAASDDDPIEIVSHPVMTGPQGLVADKLRWTEGLDAVTTTYTYSPTDRLLEISGSDGATASYRYNYQGSLSSREITKGSSTELAQYGYDQLQRLTSASSTVNSDPTVQTTNDYIGASMLRSSTTVGGVTTKFIYEGSRLRSSQRGSDDLVTYIDVPGGQWTTRGTQSLVTTHNGRGDVSGHIAASGIDTWYRYTSWGEIAEYQRIGSDDELTRAEELTPGQRYRGQWQDEGTGFIKMGYRFYDSLSGGFTRRDPIMAGRNWYAYANGDPVNKYDPSGLDWEWINGEWSFVHGGPDFDKPPAWVTPELLGGDTYLNFVDNLFIRDAYQSAQGSTTPAQRFTQTYTNLQEMMRTTTPDGSRAIQERALNIIGDSLTNVPQYRPDTWSYRTADWVQEKAAVAGDYYREQSRQGNWIVGGLGTTAETFAGGAGDGLRVGGATGEVWANGGDWREWTIALSQDTGRGASLALSAAPVGGAANALAKAEAGLANRLKGAWTGWRAGGFNVADDAFRVGDDVLRASDEVTAIDGPTLNHVSANRIALRATKGIEGSNKVVLGRWGDGGLSSYSAVARRHRAKYFELDDWADLKARGLSDDEIWKINQAFLRQQHKAGAKFLFSHDPREALKGVSFFRREVEELQSLGYRFIKRGHLWEAVKR